MVTSPSYAGRRSATIYTRREGESLTTSGSDLVAVAVGVVAAKQDRRRLVAVRDLSEEARSSGGGGVPEVLAVSRQKWNQDLDASERQRSVHIEIILFSHTQDSLVGVDGKHLHLLRLKDVVSGSVGKLN